MTDAGEIANLRSWLTTVVARVCLGMLRSRNSRRDDPLDVHPPDPVITRAEWRPESEAMLADSVGLALLIVLDTNGSRSAGSSASRPRKNQTSCHPERQRGTRAGGEAQTVMRRGLHLPGTGC